MAYCKECMLKHNIKPFATTYYYGITCKICGKVIELDLNSHSSNNKKVKEWIKEIEFM